MNRDSAVRYYPDTDTMYVEIQPGPTAGGEDSGDDLVIHYDAEGRPAGYEIEHASRHPDHIAAALSLLRRNHKKAA